MMQSDATPASSAMIPAGPSLASPDAPHAIPDRPRFDRRLIAATALVALVLLGSFGLSLRNTRWLGEHQRLVTHAHEVLIESDDILIALLNMETGQRGFVITGNPAFLGPYEEGSRELEGSLSDLERLTADHPEQLQRIQTLRYQINPLLERLKTGMALRRKDLAEAVAYIQTGVGRQMMDRIRGTLRSITDAEGLLLERRSEQNEATFAFAVQTAVVSLLLGLGLLAALLALTWRSLRANHLAAQRLYEQREWFRTTLACIGDAVIVTDPRGNVSALNPVAESLTGWPEAEAKGQPLTRVFAIVNEQTREPVENPALRALGEGCIVGLANHTTLISRGGRETPIDDSAAPIRDASGSIAGAVLIFRDIAERKRLEDDLRKYAAELSEADRRKNEFLAMLAHELRNPLAPIRNSLQILRGRNYEKSAVEHTVEVLSRQVAQMVRLIDDLLDVGRISRGRIELNREPLELSQPIAQAVESTAPHLEASGVALQIQLTDPPLRVHGDPVRLTQVVGNLLHNAAKFSEPGSAVELSCLAEGAEAVIRVRDSGVGVSADQIPRIFEMFVQVDTSLERTRGGLGIGLTLVQKIVELHGGRVEVRSAGLGQGTEFAVRLPLLADGGAGAAAGRVAAAAAPPPPPEVEPKRILVVDDNVDSAESLAMLLTLSGHEVATAHDGLAAVEAVRRSQPEVVMLDIGMPKLNGYEAARRIRQLPGGWGLLLIAITGWGQETDRARSREAGFDHHIVKPVDFDHLCRLLREAGG